MTENHSFELGYADLLAAPDTPYSVSDRLALAQQTGNIFCIKTLWMTCCYCLCQEFQPLSEPLDCLLASVGLDVAVLPPTVCTCVGAECPKIICIRIRIFF